MMKVGQKTWRMNKDIAFIAFSDIQVEDWKRFSTNHSRLHYCYTAMDTIGGVAKKHGVPVLFAGDFFDNAKTLTNYLITNTFKAFHRNFRELPFIAISGNHDQSESNTIAHKSPSHLDLYNFAFSSFSLIDGGYVDLDQYRVHGIPYLKDNVGFVEMVKKARKALHAEKPNILLVHTDFHNIKYNLKRASSTVENLPRRLNKLFKGFDLILSGHIHAPSIIRHNIVMLGATNHQRTSDMGVKMGYWIIYKDLTYSFVELNLPEFKQGEDQKDGHFYLPKTLHKKDEGELVQGKFETLDVKKLAKRYLKETNTNSKKKLKALQEYLNRGIS
jgi:DNA repair exonuclease SbcCD nuclease subunit